MRKRFWAATLAVWIIGMFCAMYFTLASVEKTEHAGAYLDGYMSEDAAYATDLRSSGSYAYKLTESGRVNKMLDAASLGFETFDDIVAGEEGPGIIASRSNKYLGYDGRSYKIYSMSDALSPLKSSIIFTLPAGQHFTGLSYEGGTWYVSSVKDDGTGAYVYSMEAASLEEIAPSADAEAEDPVAEDKSAGLLTQVYAKQSDNGLSYSDAVFRGGVLYIRSEAEEPADYLAVDKDARAVYQRANVGLKDCIRLHTGVAWVFAIIMLFGAAVIIAFIVLEGRYPHLMWTISVISVTAVIFIAIGALFEANMDSSVKVQSVNGLTKLTNSVGDQVAESEIAGIDPDDLYYSDNYRKMKTLFASSVSDMLLIDGNGNILISGSDKNQTSPGELYGEKVQKVYEDASAGTLAQDVCSIHGQEYAVSAHSLRKDYALPYVIMGLDLVENTGTGSAMNILLLLIIAFVVVSLSVIIRSILEARALRRLLKAMVDVSAGSGSDVKVPENNTGFLSRHWDALEGVVSELRRMDYATYQIYQAYFRFAPKKIETILDKSSIAEVNCGDVASFKGSEAIVTLTDRFVGSGAGIFRMNEILELMEKHQEEKGGVLVSSDMSVGLVKLIFRDNAKPLTFGLNFLHETDTMWPGDGVSAAVILHHGDFRYGVVGTSQQSMAFLDSRESRILEKYAAWLYRQGMRLIITESMKEHEHIQEGLRYIGYIDEENVHLELYEVLDANSADMRAKKLACLAKYNEAIELFKQSNFYFARNAFSEILREAPEDNLVKWYLFESERYLNQAPDEDLMKLHLD